MISAEQLVVFFSVFLMVNLIIRILPIRKSSSRCLRNPPSLPSLPLIGSLPFLRNFNNIAEFFMEKSSQLGPLFTLRVGSRFILTLNTKEVIEEALVKNSRYFSSRPDIITNRIGNPNRKGIISIEATPEMKRVHQTALAILKEFGFGVKNRMEERILSEIDAMAEFVQMKQGQSFDPTQLSYLFTSNIIANIVFGHRRDYELGISKLITEVNRLIGNSDLVFYIAPIVRFIPFYKEKLIEFADSSKTLYSLIETEIDKSIRDKVSCFVSRYIEKEGPDYDREQLNFMVRDLIMAGTETTSTTFQWMLIALANNPHVQTRLHKEIESVIPKNRLPIIQDLSKLSYHEATILELFRWRTLVPLSLAHLTTDDSILRGYFIPSGTLVLSNLHAAHCNRTEWTDPDVFRPERFLDKDNTVVGRDRVIPFGLGRRSCFGEILARAEVFLLLTSIVRRFIVLPPEGQKKVCDQLKLPITVTSGPKPFSIRLLDRE